MFNDHSVLFALGLTLLAGLAEPAGALLFYIFLRSFISSELLAVVFASVAGVIVFISFDELLPTAQHCSQQCGEHGLSIYGLFAGMAVMGLSLLMMA